MSNKYSFDIYAGKTALDRIQKEGFNQSLFSTFIGASGGPKWFTLFGWDQYLFSQFFSNRIEPLNIIGSSAGAFRAACFCQADPVAATQRLAKNYSETIYSKQVDRSEISAQASSLVDIMLGDNGINEILTNPIFKAHIFVAKTTGLAASENKLIQGLGLTKSYLLNRIDRANLRSQYERYIYQVNSNFEYSDPDRIPTKTKPLTLDNLRPALLSSGSIPMVMSGVRDIPGSPPGMYRDGGVIDYHFDLTIKTDNLVLYPHFNAKPKAGWFDKNLARNVRNDSYDNVVLLCPSNAFIASLPYNKIPDRTDFTNIQDTQRIAYWQEVFKRTEELAADLDHFIQRQDISSLKQFGD